jgi:uncharacterized membrane protein YfcA
MPGAADIFQVSLFQAGLSVIFGAAIGLLLGLVGGGGSILTVPILVYVIGLSVQSATATSLAIVGASALAGSIPHARAGRVNLRVALFFGLFGVAGAFAGTYLNQRVDGPWILLLFGVLMLGVAARMWLRRALPAAATSTTVGLSWKAPAAGLTVGLLTGFFGVGGGFLIVPALALALGMHMAVAVGTSLVIIALNSASGIAAHAGAGGLDVPVALLFIAGGLAGGVLGGRLAGRIDERQLSRAFALLVALVGSYLVVRNGLLLVPGAA